MSHERLILVVSAILAIGILMTLCAAAVCIHLRNKNQNGASAKKPEDDDNSWLNNQHFDPH